MARKAEVRVIDFTDCDRYHPTKWVQWWLDNHVHFDALDPFEGKDNVHTRPVPAHRMRRARRVLWQCRQQPDWAHTHAAFYKHPSLKNVPYHVLRQLVKESED